VLRAEGYADNQTDKSATVSLTTADEAKTIRLQADRTTLAADGQDLSFITVELVDANGRLNPIAAQQLAVTVKGAATLAAFGNADIKDEDRYCDATHRTWKGRALLVVKSTRKAGSAKVSVTGQGLRPATITIRTK
jgi:beta-galactosidase